VLPGTKCHIISQCLESGHPVILSPGFVNVVMVYIYIFDFVDMLDVYGSIDFVNILLLLFRIRHCDCCFTMWLFSVNARNHYASDTVLSLCYTVCLCHKK